MNPYYYRIRHIESNQVYIGCQYGKKSDINKFLKTYFTSSKRVSQLIGRDGVESFLIEKLVDMPNARTFERRVLRRLYYNLGREKFLTTFLNRNISPGILLDDETRAKLYSDPNRAKKIEAKKLGNTNVRGKFWWNDGTNQKRSFDKPDGSWARGQLTPSKETKERQSIAQRGRKHSIEFKLDVQRRRNNPTHMGNHKGTIWVKNEAGQRKRVFNDNIPEGFRPVNEQ